MSDTTPPDASESPQTPRPRSSVWFTVLIVSLLFSYQGYSEVAQGWAVAGPYFALSAVVAALAWPVRSHSQYALAAVIFILVAEATWLVTELAAGQNVHPVAIAIRLYFVARLGIYLPRWMAQDE